MRCPTDLAHIQICITHVLRKYGTSLLDGICHMLDLLKTTDVTWNVCEFLSLDRKLMLSYTYKNNFPYFMMFSPAIVIAELGLHFVLKIL